MKIAGLTYYDGQYHAVMKSDSSLLNQRKPFFLPDWSHEISATPCIVARIGRMGRHIAPRFAERYYDSLALGLNFRAEDKLRAGEQTEALAFDEALAVGQWIVPADFPADLLPTTPTLAEGIARISTLMTVRTGDLIFIDTATPLPVEREHVFRFTVNDTENLYCKIK